MKSGGVRLDSKLERMLAALARRRGTTKSALAREAIRRYIADADLANQAREQSLRAARAEQPDLEHDDRAWTP